MKVVSQPSIVSCYVSFRECILDFICEALPDPRAHSLLSVPRLIELCHFPGLVLVLTKEHATL